VDVDGKEDEQVASISRHRAASADAPSRAADGDGQRRRPAVMADVAALAGVSQMTVSRVINHQSRVKAETRERVVAAMSELDYRPNAAARALVTGRTSILGVVSFDTTLFGPASTLSGIEDAARTAGYFVSVASLRSITTRSIGEAVERLVAQAVDGIIVIAPHVIVADALGELAPDVPLVAVQNPGKGVVPSVSVDQEAGASRVTRYLLSLGHTAIWHIAGPDGWLEAQARDRAMRTALRAAGCPAPPALSGDWSARSGYEQGKLILESGEATAVFVGNDQMALGVLRAFSEAGLCVPGDISVVGFDDIPEAAYFAPPLTTVRQDFGELGRRSIAHLLERIDVPRGRRSQRVLIEPELVVRESTGPVPRR
jgi:DNA-binding LacI/PurR family transcriptional regulator